MSSSPKLYVGGKFVVCGSFRQLSWFFWFPSASHFQSCLRRKAHIKSIYRSYLNCVSSCLKALQAELFETTRIPEIRGYVVRMPRIFKISGIVTYLLLIDFLLGNILVCGDNRETILSMWLAILSGGIQTF